MATSFGIAFGCGVLVAMVVVWIVQDHFEEHDED